MVDGFNIPQTTDCKLTITQYYSHHNLYKQMDSNFYQIEEITDKNKKKCAMSSKLQTNFIHNRFDIMYKDNYLLFHIFNRYNDYYVPVKIIKNIAFLAIQLSHIETKALTSLTKYLFKIFPIWKLKFKFSLNNICKNPHKIYYIIHLPDDINDFNSKLSHDTRYNVTRYYVKRIEKDYKYSIKCFTKTEIIENKIYEQYCKFKEITHNYNNTQSAIEYIENNHITNAYVMYFNDKIVSITFINILDDSAFLENLTYDIKYKNYSVGTILYYNTIKDMIAKKIKIFYLYDGTGEYKKRFNGEEIKVYNGTIYKYSFINYFLHFFRKIQYILNRK